MFYIDLTLVVNVMGLSASAVFAASGALDAARQKMDILGFMLIGCATGLGGGTLRDLLLGKTPVFWIRQPEWISICLVAAVVTYLLAPHLASRTRALLWMDAIGLALFSVVGTRIGLDAGASPLIAVCMGVVTATFGGVTRDVLCGSSLVLSGAELYVTASLAGAISYLGLSSLALPASYDLIGAFLVAFTLRALAIQFHLKLPNRYRD
ncbi:MAG: putative membrane protein YeiH [Motiliproteus sp.]|jgi:uncharacterized membrane protein YeiH